MTRQLYLVVDLPVTTHERELAVASAQLARLLRGQVSGAYVVEPHPHPTLLDRLLARLGAPSHQLRPLPPLAAIQGETL